MTRTPEPGDSGERVETAGLVLRLLPDLEDKAHHQRFILDLGNRQTVLISHNLDLSGRVPVALGDRVAVRGIYEWNESGGLIHWTHRDPMAREVGGFIRHRSRQYD